MTQPRFGIENILSLVYLIVPESMENIMNYSGFMKRKRKEKIWSISTGQGSTNLDIQQSKSCK